jgi:glycosyltransferase involved in cell wall biosynthesis
MPMARTHIWDTAAGLTAPRLKDALPGSFANGEQATTDSELASSPYLHETRIARLNAAKISVVIPVYNEVSTIGETIRRVLATGFDLEVIVVDDGSTDGTSEYLARIQNPYVRCLRHAVNRGKGAALRLGFAAAVNPFVIVQDADLEYDPRDYAALLEPLMDGRADMVFGSRFLGGPHRVLLFWHFVGNRFLTLLCDMLSNLNLSDMETGLKAFKRDKLAQLSLCANRFTFEPEITIKAARAGWRIYEVPISYTGRTYAEGKKISWHDGLAAIVSMFYYRLFEQI